MTSEERHEARYQRRVKKRQERRLALSKSCGDFEDVFSYENLYQSGHICCRGVSWKSSTQTYRFNLVTNTAATRRALLDGTYKSRGFIEFDHFIKEKLGIKGYARYMDDGYLIHPSKEYLKECLTRMKEVCDSLGIILNTKKTKIKKLSEGFKFLQIRFKLTETGKVLRKMSFESIKKIRRKLKKFKLWNIEGRVVKIAGKFVRRVFPLSDICSAYESWRGHMKRGNSFHAVERMDLYFKKLFGFHPNNKIEWRKALCT